MRATEEIEYLNGTAEDLGALIGVCATIRLMAILGGRKIYIPQSASAAHVLARIIGLPAFERLCGEFGGDLMKIPCNAEAERMSLVRAVARLIYGGYTLTRIAEMLGLSARQVGRYRAQAESYGLLPMVFHGDVDKRGEAQLTFFDDTQA